MTSRERVRDTLEFRSVDRAPRDIFYPLGIEMFRKGELQELLNEYPMDFTVPKFSYGNSGKEKGEPGRVGEYVDAWGCLWKVGEPGVIGEVKKPPLEDWNKLKTYKLPWKLLQQADLSKVNDFCALTDKFVYTKLELETRPFERMQFLRGTENLLIDFAYGTKEGVLLRNMLHEFFIEEITMWSETDVDGVCFFDDCGSQQGLLVSPDFWRSFFKPLYQQYCDIIHENNKYVFFHSDGNIEMIFSDLIEIGIDAINSQLFCMNIEELGKKFKGKFTVWGEMDRQKVLPFGTVQEIQKDVQRVRSAFDDNNGGVIAQCSWGTKDPIKNIKAVFDEWMQPINS